MRLALALSLASQATIGAPFGPPAGFGFLTLNGNPLVLNGNNLMLGNA